MRSHNFCNAVNRRQFITSLSLELQQRSCEYLSLLDGSWKEVLPHALARMPAADATILCAALCTINIILRSQLRFVTRFETTAGVNILT